MEPKTAIVKKLKVKNSKNCYKTPKYKKLKSICLQNETLTRKKE